MLFFLGAWSVSTTEKLDMEVSEVVFASESGEADVVTPSPAGLISRISYLFFSGHLTQ